MKIYVAFRTDVEPNKKMACGSMTILKGRMKGTHGATGKKLKKPIDRIGAEFTVVLYDFKPNLTNVCQAISNVTELPGTWELEFKINEQNQLREVK